MDENMIHMMLGRIEAKLDTSLTELSLLKERVTILEDARNTQTGFISGGKFVWGLIKAAPWALVALLLGKDIKL